MNKWLVYGFLGWAGAFLGMLLISLAYGAFPASMAELMAFVLIPTAYVFGGVGAVVPWVTSRHRRVV